MTKYYELIGDKFTNLFSALQIDKEPVVRIRAKTTLITSLIRQGLFFLILAALCMHAKETGYILEFLFLSLISSYKYKLVFAFSFISFITSGGDLKTKFIKALCTFVIASLAGFYIAASSGYHVQKDGLIDEDKITAHQLDMFRWFEVNPDDLRVPDKDLSN